ncbi:MAG: 4-(cytidine 5'-diphospho)-2-C-methyl-D-erythritol kinase, partial [Saezia sp.]
MTPQRLENILSPAKLNLFLHVTGQRPDGYHLLQSVFVAIDWYDTLHFERREDGKILRHDLNNTPLPEQDLSVRAAQMLQKMSGTSFGADIFLHKTIPMQAGLGGGSSNAATTLLALNKLWGLNLDTSLLLPLAKRLGSDVPFFLHNGPAWVEGAGELLTPISLPADIFKTPIAVLKPDQGV